MFLHFITLAEIICIYAYSAPKGMVGFEQPLCQITPPDQTGGNGNIWNESDY